MAIGTPTNAGTSFISSSGTTATLTGVTAAVGDLLVVTAGLDGGVVPSSVTDSAGNTYTADITAVRDSGFITAGVFSTVVTSALTSGTITVTYSGLSGTWDKYVAAIKITGSWDSSRVDKTATGQATTGATWSSGATAATTVADEVVLGFGYMGINNNSTAISSTPGTGYTEIHDVDTGLFVAYTSEYKIVNATGAQTASGTWAGLTTRHWIAFAITYKEAGGGTAQQLAATIASVAHMTAALSVGKPLASTIASQGRMTANVSTGAGLAATIASRGTVTAALTDAKQLAASIASRGAMTAQLAVSKPLAALIASRATVISQLQVGAAVTRQRVKQILLRVW